MIGKIPQKKIGVTPFFDLTAEGMTCLSGQRDPSV
jgi:hypothetical protein